MARWGSIAPGLLHGLKLAAVAVVAQAVWGMARNLCRGAARATIMCVAACATLAWPTAWAQVGVIAAGALAGLALFGNEPETPHDPLSVPLTRRAGALLLAAFFILLGGLPLAAQAFPGQALALVDAFYRSGALVFGGGHVVLPLLQSQVVPPGWIDNNTFLAGYGATQAMPGPLFTFAAFLGAAMQAGPGGWAGGALCLLAIFLPSFLLVAGALPFWARLGGARRVRAALAGVNAAVVGLLLGALYSPVWTSAVNAPADFMLALVAFVALMFWRLPPWLVVVGAGAAGWLASGVF
jgi:chromate transporter